MNIMEFVKTILPFVRPFCYLALGCFAAYVVYKRAANKVITYSEIQQFAESECVPGDICHISRISDVPEEIQKQIRSELGIQQIINGYRFDGSILVTITDSQGNIKDTSYFMGKQLDKDLLYVLSIKIDHRITF